MDSTCNKALKVQQHMSSMLKRPIDISDAIMSLDFQSTMFCGLLCMMKYDLRHYKNWGVRDFH